MKKKKHNPKSEAAQREAIRNKWDNLWTVHATDETVEVVAYVRLDGEEVALVRFDLRDCYRKRAPLKGITKALRKVVQPKRKR